MTDEDALKFVDAHAVVIEGPPKQVLTFQEYRERYSPGGAPPWYAKLLLSYGGRTLVAEASLERDPRLLDAQAEKALRAEFRARLVKTAVAQLTIAATA